MQDGKDTTKTDLSALKIDPEARPDGERGSRRALWIGLVASALGLLLITVLALGGRKRRVEVAEAKPGSGTQAMTILNASGYVTPRRRATVAAKITGRVKDVLVDEGMTVKEGQVLARLDDSDAQAAYAAAKADKDVAVSAIKEAEVNVADANRTLKRNRALLKDGFVDKETVDHDQAIANGLEARLKNLKNQVAAVEARIEMAQRDIENCTVRAPFSGIAVSKDAQPGEMVSPISAGGGFTRTGISTVVDMDSLEIEVDVNESYIAKVMPGQKVEAVLDAYPDWRIPSSVRTIIPTADRQKATVKVRISFGKLDPRILPDMGVKVSFLSGEQSPDQAPVKAIVPKEAVREEGGQSVVFIFREGRIERRAVRVGKAREGELEIFAGISPGERVVVAGPKNLKDGQKAVIR